MSARCQGKTVKYFAQAVKEICVAFEESQREKSSGSGHNTEKSALGCGALSVDRDDVDLKDGTCAVISNGETKAEEIGDFGSKMEPCSNNCGETDGDDLLKHAISCPTNDGSSPVLPSEKTNKVSNGPQSKEVTSEFASDNVSNQKQEASADKKEVKKHSDKRQRAFPNGNKLKKMVSGSKRRFEGSVEGHKGSSGVTSLKDDSSVQCGDFPDPGEQLKDKLEGKNASNGSIKELPPDALKSDSDIGGGKTKDVHRAKRGFKGSDDVLDAVANSKVEVSGAKKSAQAGNAGKLRLGTNGILNPIKKSKCVDSKDDATRVPISKDMKGGVSSPNIVDSKAVEFSDLKHSTSHVKKEMVLALRAQTVKRNVGSDVSGDEAVLPLTKRRKRALEAMSDSVTLKSDDKVGKSSREVKNDMSCSDNVRPQLAKRRRAVCLFDEDDDDEPKTPVHGGSGNNAKALSSISDKQLASSVKAQNDGARDSTGFENSILKEPPAQSHNETVSPGQPANEESRPASYVASNGGKEESEHLPLKEAKAALVSPNKSPHLVSATRTATEQNKASKSLVTKGPTAGSLKKAQAVSGKGSGSISDSMNSSQNHVPSQRNKPASSGERPKTTPKAASHVNERAALTETSIEHSSLPGEMYV